MTIGTPETLYVAAILNAVVCLSVVLVPSVRSIGMTATAGYVRALVQKDWETRHFILTPEDNFSIDLAALEHTLAEGYDALYLCNPGNPSGTLYPLPVIEKIYSLCSASGTFLVLDEAFMDFCETSSAKHDIVTGNNGIVLRSMTKFFGIPGLRLGYALAGTTMAERLDAVGGPWSVNTLALTAGVAALGDTGHNQQTIERRASSRNRRVERRGRGGEGDRDSRDIDAG